MDEIDQLDYYVSPEDRQEALRVFMDNLKEDSPAGRRAALRAVWDWYDKKKEPEEPPQAVNPPEGFRDTGRTSNGKKVYISADGKKAWIQP